MAEFQDKKVFYVSGHTSVGVYRNDGPYDMMVDLKKISDFYLMSNRANSISFGAGYSLTDVIDFFDTASANKDFEYLAVLAAHIKKIANVPVRNVSTSFLLVRMVKVFLPGRIVGGKFDVSLSIVPCIFTFSRRFAG